MAMTEPHSSPAPSREGQGASSEREWGDLVQHVGIFCIPVVWLDAETDTAHCTSLSLQFSGPIPSLRARGCEGCWLTAQEQLFDVGVSMPLTSFEAL